MTTKEDYECWAAGKIIAAEARGEARGESKGHADAIGILKDMGFPAEQIAEVQARLDAKATK